MTPAAVASTVPVAAADYSEQPVETAAPIVGAAAAALPFAAVEHTGAATAAEEVRLSIAAALAAEPAASAAHTASFAVSADAGAQPLAPTVGFHCHRSSTGNFSPTGTGERKKAEGLPPGNAQMMREDCVATTSLIGTDRRNLYQACQARRANNSKSVQMPPSPNPKPQQK